MTKVSENHKGNNANTVLAVVFCQILVDEKHRGFYLQSHQCRQKAVCEVQYKLTSKSENVISKKCCTRHRNMFLRQIDRDDFAELISVENLR
jgi:hypothetical protein